MAQRITLLESVKREGSALLEGDMILVAHYFCAEVPFETLLVSMQKVAEVAFSTLGVEFTPLNSYTDIWHRVSLKVFLELLRLVIPLEVKV